MHRFTLDGVTHTYLTPAPPAPETIQSWEYRHWPRVEAEVPLAGKDTVTVYGEAMRWAVDVLLVRWQDDEGHFHSAWIPKANVRRLTASEWDIIAYHRCPENLRSIQWADRLPGFLSD